MANVIKLDVDPKAEMVYSGTAGVVFFCDGTDVFVSIEDGMDDSDYSVTPIVEGT